MNEQTLPTRQRLLEQIEQLARHAIYGTLSESYRTCGNPRCRCHRAYRAWLDGHCNRPGLAGGSRTVEGSGMAAQPVHGLRGILLGSHV